MAVAFACMVGMPLGAADSPAGDLKAAVEALQAKRTSTAIMALEPLPKRLPKLADYIAFFLATAEFDGEDYKDVVNTLRPVYTQTPPSPLVWRAVLLGAQALQKSAKSRESLDLLRTNYAVLPQPQGDLVMAKAFAAVGDAVSAAVYFQRVYYAYPANSEAAEAEREIIALQAQLAGQYPPAMGNAMLGRALKLLDAGQAERARKELMSLLPQLGGADREAVQVKIGVADYNLKHNAAAQRYLADLKLESPEADAERLHYLLLCARRANDRDAMNAVLAQLAQTYTASTWRLEGLLATGNSYLTENRADAYEPLYRACFEDFPKESRAAGCHWKVAWTHYLNRRTDAADLLRQHVRLFPNSDDSSAALYFLGRLAEDAKEPAGARSFYNEVVREYPNYFYATQARERLNGLPAVAATPPAVNEFLRTVTFATRSRVRSFEPNALAKLRLERSRLLAAAGLDDWALVELRFAAQNEDQPHVMGLELALTASRQNAPDQAIRYLKRYAPDYLYLPLESAPGEFWKLAFPIPYRAELEKFAKQNNVDPFLLAALARQESEFNPKAVSVASARGLTQIMPTTGRELSRRLQLKSYNTARLFQPSVNLQMGAFYLKSIADKLSGRWEAALAAYNAGLSRANAWSAWGEFREPAEFIETVPFSQTHDYIQIVLRNADIYRRLYANEAPTGPVLYSNGVDQPKKSSRATGAR